MKKKSVILFSLLNLLAAIVYYTPVSAQGVDGGIAVAVYNSNGNPISNASVRVFNFSGDKGIRTTNVKGRGIIRELPPGRYSVMISTSTDQIVKYTGVLVQPGQDTKLSYRFIEDVSANDTIHIEYIPPRSKKTKLRIHSNPH